MRYAVAEAAIVYSRRTACSYRKRLADGLHFLPAQRSDKKPESLFVDGLNVVQINRAGVFQPLVDPNDDFTRSSLTADGFVLIEAHQEMFFKQDLYSFHGDDQST